MGFHGGILLRGPGRFSCQNCPGTRGGIKGRRKVKPSKLSVGIKIGR